jgi:hypothetical protein
VNNIVRAVKTSVLVCSVAVLTACGGGGGGGGDTTTPSSLNFSLLSAWQDHTKKSLSQNFTISGTCSGSGSNIVTPIRPATGTTQSVSGQGTPISYLETGTMNTFYTNCTGSGSQDRVVYYDGNYHPIQVAFASEPATGLFPRSTQQFFVYSYTSSIPAVIRAGDSLTIGTVNVLTRFCDVEGVRPCSTRRDGGGDLSVRARSESAESILVDFVTNIAIDGVASRNTATYRLTSTGMFTPIQDVIEGGNAREVWTY